MVWERMLLLTYSAFSWSAFAFRSQMGCTILGTIDLQFLEIYINLVNLKSRITRIFILEVGK